MSKFRYGWDEKKYERFLKEGRGKGEGENNQRYHLSTAA